MKAKEIKEGPVRAVTRREIVSGEYGPVNINSYIAQASILLNGPNSAEDCRDAAHVFNQLAEALEGEGK